MEDRPEIRIEAPLLQVEAAVGRPEVLPPKLLEERLRAGGLIDRLDRRDALLREAIAIMKGPYPVPPRDVTLGLELGEDIALRVVVGNGPIDDVAVVEVAKDQEGERHRIRIGEPHSSHAILGFVATEQSFDRWYILKSADAMASRSYSTQEIVEAYESGDLSERIVIYHRYESRREAMTVKDLVARERNKKKK